MTDFWDYTALAASYDMRPDYCAPLIDDCLMAMGLRSGQRVLEVGAGTGKLTGLLLKHSLQVLALEPNAAMRIQAQTKAHLKAAQWVVGVGEALPVTAGSMDLVAYGSSFNVLDATVALNECARVLKPGGHWFALWNHRDLGEPLQAEAERVIQTFIPGYNYGRRRQSPEADLRQHGGFANVVAVERGFTVQIAATDWLLAWESHATLQRQAAGALPAILDALKALAAGRDQLTIPYVTRAWWAQRR